MAWNAIQEIRCTRVFQDWKGVMHGRNNLGLQSETLTPVVELYSI